MAQPASGNWSGLSTIDRNPGERQQSHVLGTRILVAICAFQRARGLALCGVPTPACGRGENRSCPKPRMTTRWQRSEPMNGWSTRCANATKRTAIASTRFGGISSREIPAQPALPPRRLQLPHPLPRRHQRQPRRQRPRRPLRQSSQQLRLLVQRRPSRPLLLRGGILR